MKTKILSVFTALSMIFTGVSAIPAEGAAQSIFSDAEAQQVLVDLGFMKNDIDDAFHPEKKLTRAEFASLVIKMRGGVLTGKSEEELKAKYADYFEFEEVAQEADTAVELGYIAAYSDNFFRPNEPVPYKDVIRLCINSLGYNLYEGLYDTPDAAYLAAVSKLPYLSRLGLNMDEPAQRGTSAYIIYKTLDSDMLKAVAFGKQNIYETQKGHTIFTDILKIEKFEGRVDANEFTHIDRSEGLSRGQIKINGTVFNAPNTFGLLGYDVTAYYSTEDDDNKILSIVKKTKEKDETVILSEDIREYKNGKLYFQTADGVIENLEIKPSADIIYNGVAYPDYPEEIFEIGFGEVRVIDNSGDMQTVLVTSYEVEIVTSVNYEENVIYGKYAPDKIVNYGAYRDCLFIDEKGSIATERSVKANSAILIAKSAGDNFITVKQPELKTTDVVEEVAREARDGEITGVTFGQKIYAVAKNARGDMAVIAPGVTVTIFLERGVIVSFREAAYGDDMKFGYLADCAMNARGLSKTLKLKIFTADGELNVFNCNSKIRVDGVSLKINDTTTSAVNLLNEIIGAKGKIIRYMLNQEGEIIDIDLPYSDSVAPKSALDRELLRLDYKAASKLIYRVGQKTFDGKVNINENTVLFVVANNENEEMYSILPVSALKNAGKYMIDSYCMGPDIVISAAGVLRIAPTSIDESPSAVSVVDKITAVLGENGEIVYKIYAFNQAGVISVLVTDKNLLNGIGQGDIIRWQEFNGKAFFIEEIFDAATLTQKLYSTSTYSASLSLTYKNVYSYNDGIWQMTSKTDMSTVTRSDLTSYILSACPTYVLDSERQILQIGSEDDICDYKSTGKYSRVFLYVSLGTPKLLVIYK